MRQEVKSWMFIVENRDFVEVRCDVEEILQTEYEAIGKVRVVAATVFYPLKIYSPKDQDNTVLQVWVIPRHGRRVIVKVSIRDRDVSYIYGKRVHRSYEKIVKLLTPMARQGKVVK